MRKKCPECENGFKLVLDGDGYGSEVICDNCNGKGWVENPDAERDIKNDD